MDLTRDRLLRSVVFPRRERAPLLIVIAIADFILIIVGTVKAKNGERFVYPWTIRFIK